MLNMGGPESIPNVKPFLLNLFRDSDILQSSSFFTRRLLPRLIVRSRLSKVEQQYKDIGGGSPILRWTNLQGRIMVDLLNQSSAENIEFFHFVAFRYVYPNAFDALRKMKETGIDHAIAFSQYPQYSCTTTGSSLNHLWSAVREMGMENDFSWSLIDRWPVLEGFIQTIANNVELALRRFSSPKETIIVFSAHSLPIKTVNRGDSYVQEVHQTVCEVVRVLREKNIHNVTIAAWQSKVGPLEWQGPQTGAVLRSLGREGREGVLVVPVAFTSDHIETLYEIDVEYRKEALDAGVRQFERAECPNASPTFVEGLAGVVRAHLTEKKNFSNRYSLKCPGCWQRNRCRQIINPAFN